MHIIYFILLLVFETMKFRMINKKNDREGIGKFH